MEEEDDRPLKTQLSDAEKAALEGRFLRLSVCFWAGCLFCCCTACTSWLPYSFYRWRSESTLKGRAEPEAAAEAEGPQSLSIEGPANMV